MKRGAATSTRGSGRGGGRAGRTAASSSPVHPKLQQQRQQSAEWPEYKGTDEADDDDTPQPIRHSNVSIVVETAREDGVLFCRLTEAFSDLGTASSCGVFCYRNYIAGTHPLMAGDLLKVDIESNPRGGGRNPWRVIRGIIQHVRKLNVDNYLTQLERAGGVDDIDIAATASVARMIHACTAPFEQLLELLGTGHLRQPQVLHLLRVLHRVETDCTNDGNRAVMHVVWLLERAQFWAVLQQRDWLSLWRNHKPIMVSLVKMCLHISQSVDCLRAVRDLMFHHATDEFITSAEFQDFFNAHLRLLDSASSRSVTQSNSWHSVIASRMKPRLLPTSYEMQLSEDEWVNIVKQTVPPNLIFSDVDKYLDAMHHILRVDMFAGLTQTIQAVTRETIPPGGAFVYQSVTIVGIGLEWVRGHVFIAFTMEERLRSYDWDTSRRLMHNNLLALIVTPPDGVHQLIWATVSYRDAEMLSQGRVGITFLTAAETHGQQSASEQQLTSVMMNPANRVRMVESPTYFHALAPAVGILRNSNAQRLPLADRIVNLHESAVPVYPLTTMVDGDIFCPGCGCIPLAVALGMLDEGQASVFEQQQSRAAAAALNAPLALIQGPPGTGKTYMGVQLLRAWLSMSPEALGGPILVLAHKNHALDQLAEGLLPFCRGTMIRVGGLFDEDSPLAEIHHHVRIRGQPISREASRARFEAAEAARAIEHLSREVKSSTLSLDTLLRFATREQVSVILVGATPQSVVRPVDWQEVSRARRGPGVSKLQSQLEQVFLEKPEQRFEVLQEYPSLLERLQEQFEAWKPSVLEMVAVSEQRRPSPAPPLVPAILHPRQSPNSVAGAARSVSDGSSTTSDDDLSVQDISDQDVDDDDGRDNEEREQDDAWEDSSDDEGSTVAESNDSVPHNAGGRPRRSRKRNRIRQMFELQGTSSTLTQRSMTVSLAPNQVVFSGTDRAAFALMLLQQQEKALLGQIAEEWHKYQMAAGLWQRYSQDRLLRAMLAYRVVFMTVSGAVIRADAVNALKPAVVLVEEAAEVMESLLAAAIPPSVRQVVQIGDHKQLRPSLNCYPLVKECKVDTSQFERLWQTPGVVSESLHRQARMPHNIASLVNVEGQLYDKYTTWEEQVAHTPPFKGLVSNLYFVNTEGKESSAPGTSKRNQQEADYVLKCVFQLLEMRVPCSRFVVLAAYAGQVSLLRRLMHDPTGPIAALLTSRGSPPDAAEDIQVFSIDQYQGKESDIVLVSLVRSAKIGYLKQPGRACVALTRAKSTLILFGNSDLLAAHGGPLWESVMTHLNDVHAVVPVLEFVCCAHPSERRVLRRSDRLPLPPVCTQRCGQRLPCGHCCTSNCHAASDPDAHLCQTPCSHVLPCNHACKQTCHAGQNHPPCSYPCPRAGKCKDAHPCDRSCGEPCTDDFNCKLCAELHEKNRREALLQQAEAIEHHRKELAALPPPSFDDSDQRPVESDSAEFDDICQRMYNCCRPLPWAVECLSIKAVCSAALESACIKARAKLRDCISDSSVYAHFCNERDAGAIVKNGFTQRAQPTELGQGFLVGDANSAHSNVVLLEVFLGSSQRVLVADPNYDRRRAAADRCDSIHQHVLTASGAAASVRQRALLFNHHLIVPRYVVKVRRLDSFYHLLGQLPPTLRSAGVVVRLSKPAGRHDDVEAAAWNMISNQFLEALQNSPRRTEFLGIVPTAIHVIRNPGLSARFHKVKEVIQKTDDDLQERMVFHGTLDDNFVKIATEGFKVGGSVGHPVRVGQRFGYGVYCSTNPIRSVVFSNDCRKVLLCKAVLGKQSEGTRSSPASGKTYGYYRPVDSTEDPDVIVLFQSAQVLPIAIIEY